MSNENEETTWKLQKAKLQQAYGTLTDNDLMILDGKKDELLERIRIKIGKTKDELMAFVKDI
ncbi:MAG: general stress protein CsbD [Flavobacteriales bacterium]